MVALVERASVSYYVRKRSGAGAAYRPPSDERRVGRRRRAGAHRHLVAGHGRVPEGASARVGWPRRAPLAADRRRAADRGQARGSRQLRERALRHRVLVLKRSGLTRRELRMRRIAAAVVMIVLGVAATSARSEEHTSELQSQSNLV